MWWALFLSVAGQAPANDDIYERLETLARVMTYVERDYVDPLSPEHVVDAALFGVMSSLDEHSRYIARDQLASLRLSQHGQGRLGLEIVHFDRRLVVSEVYPDTPADRAGCRPGDEIIQVNDQTTVGRSLKGAIALLHSPEARAQLLVKRGGNTTMVTVEKTFTAPRSITVQPLGENMLHLKIHRFLPQTFLETQKALEQANFGGLLLDLRNNPGGRVDVATQVADLWLKDGIIASTVARRGETKVFRAHPDGTEPGYPIVVLVNGRTASAAEILVAALKSHQRAEVVGTPTFGKGTIQSLIQLPDQSAIKITVGRYLNPDQIPIQAQGIQPDTNLASAAHPPGDARFIEVGLTRLRARLYP